MLYPKRSKVSFVIFVVLLTLENVSSFTCVERGIEHQFSTFKQWVKFNINEKGRMHLCFSYRKCLFNKIKWNVPTHPYFFKVRNPTEQYFARNWLNYSITLLPTSSFYCSTPGSFFLEQRKQLYS